MFFMPPKIYYKEKINKKYDGHDLVNFALNVTRALVQQLRDIFLFQSRFARRVLQPDRRSGHSQHT